MTESSSPFETPPVRIPVEALQPVLEQMLIKMSLFQFDAATAAQRILEADLHGIPAEGCARVPGLLEAIELGDVDPRGRILKVVEAPAFTVLDGSRALGHVAATKGVELAVALARDQGTGLVVIGNSQSLGAAEVYVRMIAAQGLIGFCLSSTGCAVVSTPETGHPAVGMGKMAYALPVESEPPVVFATGSGSIGDEALALLRRSGIPVAEAIPTGHPEYPHSLPPTGGELGFGLSLLCGALAGPLAGGRMPLNKKKRPSADDSQHVLAALDIGRFCDPVRFQRELASTLAAIRGLKPSAPDAPVTIPGDHGTACQARILQHGIALPQSVRDELASRARKLKVPVPW